MIVWLDARVVQALHDRQLAEHGGRPGVRGANLLESALGRPQQLYAYGDPLPDLAELAASLVFGLVRNHPFIDGNKRTAHVAYRTFLALNGAEMTAADEQKYLTILALAEGKLTEREFAAWLRAHISTRLRHRVQEPPVSIAKRKPTAKRVSKARVK